MTNCRPHRLAFHVILAVCLSMLAVGCALPRLAWERADDIIVQRANEWLALEAQQQAGLQARLEPWLREIRRERLAELARTLEKLATRLTPEINRADARWAEAHFQEIYDRTVESFIPVLAPTLVDLGEHQVKHLAQRFLEHNREDREHFVTGRDQGRYAVAKRIVEQIEPWTGHLDTKQRALVHARTEQLPVDGGAAWLAYRSRMQQRLLAALENGASASELERILHAWWVERAGRTPEEARKVEAFRRSVRNTLVAVSRSLSPLQRAEARRRLRDRAAILRQLVETAYQ